jgi:hypothetical protein
MSKMTLTPMLVQYLVGLCCLRWDPDAVESLLAIWCSTRPLTRSVMSM